MSEMNDVLFCFRLRLVAVSGDIAAFLHQVKVSAEDQPSLWYFHREPGSTDPPDAHQFLSFPFGLVPSMFVAIFALQQ